MNRDDIIRMAIEAGLLPGEYTGRLEVFAALVISHHVKETRLEVAESMATWLQQIAYQHGGIGDLSRTEMEFGAMVAAAEREACAKECDKHRFPDSYTAICCAAAIRNRGTA